MWALQEGNLSFLYHFRTSRCQPHCFSKLDILGLVLLLQILEVGVPDMEHQPLAPLREASAWWDPSLLCSWAGGGFFFGESVSLTLLSILMWFFNPFFCRAVHLVFRYFSEGNYPYATVDLLCLWEDRSSGSSCATILDPSPNPIYNLPIREPQAYMTSLENSPKQLRKILSILHKLFHVIEK